MSSSVHIDVLTPKSMTSLNLSVLQRADRSIKKVLSSAGHVAIYRFFIGNKSWEREDVEGSLFVVER